MTQQLMMTLDEEDEGVFDEEDEGGEVIEARPVEDAPQVPDNVTKAPSMAMNSNNGQVIKATERAEMHRAQSQVYAMYQMACEQPRDEDRCCERMVAVCGNLRFASKALYKIPVGGSETAEGFNIGAAKEFARIWRHLDYGTVSHGCYDGESQLESFCLDVQNNIRPSYKYTVSHSYKVWEKQAKGPAIEVIKTEKDPARIRVKEKAVKSREERQVIIAVLPQYIVDQCIQEVKRTLFQAVRDVPAAFRAHIKRYDKAGITEENLLRHINRKIGKKNRFENVNASDIVELDLLWESLKARDLTFDQVFPDRIKPKAALVSTKPEEEKKEEPPKSTGATLPDSDQTQQTAKPATQESQPVATKKSGESTSEAKPADPKPASAAKVGKTDAKPAPVASAPAPVPASTATTEIDDAKEEPPAPPAKKESVTVPTKAKESAGEDEPRF